MQLARIALGAIEPEAGALVAVLRAGRVQVSVDGQVVAHRVALDHAPHAADETRLALAVGARGGKADLVAADRRKVALHRQPRSGAVGVGVAEVHERLAAVQRHRFQRDPVVARRQRAAGCAHANVQIVWARLLHAVAEIDALRILERLVELASDGDSQCVLVRADGAILGVQMQHQHLAPDHWRLEFAPNVCKRMVDDRVDVAAEPVRCFVRGQYQRSLEHVAGQLRLDRLVLGLQRVRSVARLRRLSARERRQ